MGLGTDLANEGGSSVENLRKRQQAMQGGGEKPAPAPAKKRAEAKPNGKSNGKVEAKSNGKTDKPKAKPGKNGKTVKAEGKNGKAKAEKRERHSRPEGTKVEGRSLDRDRKGDGLRDVERSVLKLVEKAGDISILNLAGKLFKRPVEEIPSEGVDSIRVVRNAVRRPIEMGLMEWAGRGTVKVTKAFVKDGTKIAERYMEKVRKANEAKRAEAKTTKTTKPAKSKKADKKADKKASKTAKSAKKGGKASKS
jgi:hypothetical protein